MIFSGALTSYPNNHPEWESTLTDDLRFALRFEKKVLDDLKRRMSKMDGG